MYKQLFYLTVTLLIVTLFWMGDINIAVAQVIPGQYIVVLKENVADVNAVAADIARAHGLNLIHTYSFALKGFAVSGVPAGKLAALRQDARVAYIEQDLVAKAVAQTLPTGIDRADADLNDIADIDGVDERVDVDIAIIDTGIDLDHPDLNVFYDKNFIGGPSGDDDNGHGTHVAGTAAALDNGIGVVGMAPGARLWALKVLKADGTGDFSAAIAAIDFVTANANQIEAANMSLRGIGRLDSLRTAITNSVKVGVVHVVAAGNDLRDVYGLDGIFNTGDDVIPAAYPEAATISAMADFDGQAGGLNPQTRVFEKCTHTGDDVFACFTNFSRSVVGGNPVTSPGAAIDLAAPGVDIFSTWKNGGYNTISGTSMASPHVAGAVALYIAEHGRATNATGVAAIRQALINATQPQSEWGPLDTKDPDANPEGLINVAAKIPDDLVLKNITVEIGQTKSWEASNSIIAAGEGTFFIVAGDGINGGNATFTAGKYIILKPGFESRKGSRFNARINPSLKQLK